MSIPVQMKPAVTRLNGVCPYYTMFPLSFPQSVLRTVVDRGEVTAVLDPFCGRGTTLFAARLAGVPAVGVDCSSLAVTITRAKMVDVGPPEIVREYDRLVEDTARPPELPRGNFWELAYQPDVLRDLCHVRSRLSGLHATAARAAVTAIIAGALHGPTNKGRKTYLSNQAPRTFSPKPGYAVRFWHDRGTKAPWVSLREIVSLRAEWYYAYRRPEVPWKAVQGDSRSLTRRALGSRVPNLVITSPPYWGMRTYSTDQWLRMWFLGGPPHVDYAANDTMDHSSPEAFARDLGGVWGAVAAVTAPEATMVVRFGSIPSRPVDALALFISSLAGTPWKILRHERAGSSSNGKRQADHFSSHRSTAATEYDIWCGK